MCALDNERAGDVGALTSREAAAAAVAESARRGYLDGQALAGVFAWLRPNDLVWNYVVNNYLLGKKPPAFDVLYWNQDAVRLAAGLHRDFVRLALDNSLTRAGGLEVLGSPVDLAARRRSTATSSPGCKDHIVPVAERVPQHAAAGRREALRAVDQRPHPGARQPARARLALQLPRRRRAPRRPAGLPRPGGQAARQLVARLRRVAAASARATCGRRPKKLGGGGHRALGKAPGTYVLAS